MSDFVQASSLSPHCKTQTVYSKLFGFFCPMDRRLGSILLLFYSINKWRKLNERLDEEYAEKILRSYDYSIIAVYFLLCLFGLIMIYSASMVVAVQWFGYPADFFYEKQKINLLVGFLFFCFSPFFHIKHTKIKPFSFPLR